MEQISIKSINRNAKPIFRLTDPSVQGVYKLFVLSFENSTDRTVHTKGYISIAEVKDYNAMIFGQNVFDQSVKKDLKICDSIWKIAADQADDYTTICLLSYNYFNNYFKMNNCFKMITINLSKQQALEADPKAMQQISFTGNLNWGEDVDDNITMYFLLKKWNKLF